MAQGGLPLRNALSVLHVCLCGEGGLVARACTCLERVAERLRVRDRLELESVKSDRQRRCAMPMHAERWAVGSVCARWPAGPARDAARHVSATCATWSLRRACVCVPDRCVAQIRSRMRGSVPSRAATWDGWGQVGRLGGRGSHTWVAKGQGLCRSVRRTIRACWRMACGSGASWGEEESLLVSVTVPCDGRRA